MAEQSQIQAAKRHVYTSAGTLITAVVAIAMLPADKVNGAIHAIHRIGDDVKDIFGAFSVLSGIVGPTIVYLAGKGATAAASFPNQVKAIITKAFSSTGDTASAAKTALVQAVDTMTVPGSDTEHTEAAKVAIVNAAAKLSDKVVAPALASNPQTAANVVAE